MNKQKGLPRFAVEAGLAPILIVILIALGIGGYLIYQKQTKSVSQPVIQSTPVPSNPESSASAETANWKTFTNTKYGYTFKYPNSWFIKDMTRDLHQDTLFLNNTQTIDSKNYIIDISVDPVNILTAKGYLNFGDAGFQNKAQITTTDLNGKEITKAVVTLYQRNPNTGKLVKDSTSYRILIPLGSKTLRLDSKLNVQDMMDKILSTFKFTQ